MATNAEQIQIDLAKANITMWEPRPLSETQLSACLLGCMILDIDAKSVSISDAVTAIADIEDIATGNTGVDDVVFEDSTPIETSVWSMVSHATGVIYFGKNNRSTFYNDYVIPGVSTATVPIQEDLGDGNGLVDRAASDILRDRITLLNSSPIEVLEATINGLAVYKGILEAKKLKLEETYV